MAPFPATIPRRWAFLALLLAFVFLITTLTSSSRHQITKHLPSSNDLSSLGRGSSLHPANWLPDLVSPFSSGSAPVEFDEYGRCLFLSPFDALSDQEKARAEAMTLDEVSEGIVRSLPKIFTPPIAPHLRPPSNSTSAKFKSSSTGMIVEDAPSLSNPILALLMKGERKWQDLVSKQSKTIEEAVREYKERWGRNPPKGFDLWWDFVKNSAVMLPDEFDAINEALLPFWAFAPTEMAARNVEAETVKETFTLIVDDGKVELQWNDDYSRDTWWASRPRADAQINLMEPFMDKLPSFRATFTVHDQPSIMPSYDRMKELTDHAKKGDYTKKTTEKDENIMDWVAACGKDTPVGRGETEDPSPETFVSSHLAAMNPCQHPSLLVKHGMPIEIKNAESQPKPHTRILPIFVPSRTLLHADIPITPIGKDGRRDDVGTDPSWASKSGKMYWRGLATGLQHNKFVGANWRNSHRERLHSIANNITDGLQSVLIPVGATGKAQEVHYSGTELSQYYMDVKMSGGAWQCDRADGSCGEMIKEYEFAEKDSPNHSNLFKYIFDTDGNAWSSRFPRLMASKGMVIKSSIFPEWNTHTMPEWYAYVPSKMDYSDIYTILAFFRGTPKGKGGHDEVARRIASNGQCWVEKTWRREDMQAYMFRLYLEWARVMSPDRDTGKLDFVITPRTALARADTAAQA